MPEEKSEKPSAQKLKKARNQGQVPKSTEVITLTCLLGSIALIYSFSPKALGIVDFLQRIWQKNPNFLHLDQFLLSSLKESFWLFFKLTAPLASTALFLVILGHILQFGFLFTSETLKFDLNKINPINGLKKLVGKEKLFNLLKSLLKFFFLTWIIFDTVKSSLYIIKDISINNIIHVFSAVLYKLLIRIFIFFIILAIFDYFWQKFSFNRSLKMTKHELKKEYKDQEGDPKLKSERKALYEDMMEEAMNSFDNASVLIINPEHLAVALYYNENYDEAPKVIAKGQGEKALRLKKLAEKLNIPVMRNVSLAQDLQWLEINEQIPEHLFQTVAEIISFVHEINKKHS